MYSWEPQSGSGSPTTRIQMTPTAWQRENWSAPYVHAHQVIKASELMLSCKKQWGYKQVKCHPKEAKEILQN